MKELFLQHKKVFLSALIIISMAVVIVIARLVISTGLVNKTADELDPKEPIESAQTNGWVDENVRQLHKEISWLDQQLAVSKSDSISLGINLHDSTVQVQLKGTVLFQTKIIKQKPEKFLDEINPVAYKNIFGKVLTISNEAANTPKRPIKRVAAPNSEAAKTEVKQDTIIEKKFVWHLHLNNNMNVIINGVQLNSDSIFDLKPGKDILKFRFNELFSELKPEKYRPTLFLWLNENDAKAFYRAIPEGGRVIIRN